MPGRFEREYLRLDREEAEWNKLEKKLEAETIDITTPMEVKRKWFRETFDYKADDLTIKQAWERRNGQWN